MADEATGKAIDKTEFGVTIGLGEVGKVALAHTNQRDKMVEVMPTIQDWINTFEPNQPTTLNPGEENTPYDPGTDDMHTAMMGTGEDAMEVSVVPITVFVLANNELFTTYESGDTEGGDIDPMALTETNLRLTDNGIQRLADGRYTVGALTAECNADGDDATFADNCVSFTAYVHRVIANDIGTAPIGGGAITPPAGATVGTETYYAPADVTSTTGDPEVDGEPNTPTTGQEGTAAGFGAAPESTMKEVAGHKTTHVAVEFSVGGVTPYLGYSKEKKNGSTQEKKTTHYGLSGSLGDTGVGYLVAGRSIKDTDGMKTSPWLVNVWKDLGGGATVIFGHGNDDNGKSGKSRVGLHVGF